MRAVQEALERARALNDIRVAQQQQLTKAMEAHQRDMLAEAARLRKAAAWPPVPLVPEGSLERKRQTALVSHEKRLQSSVRAWTGIVAEHTGLWKAIMDNVDRSLKGDPLEVIGGARILLIDVVKRVGRGEARPALDYTIEVGTLRCRGWGILDQVSGMEDARVTSARRRLERMAKTVSELEEVKELKKLHRRWETISSNLVDALEDLALRRLTAGRCQWCPGAPGVRARPLPAG